MRRGTLIVLVRRESTDSIAPLVPAAWDIIHEADGWFSVYPLGRQERDVFFHMRHMMSHPTFARAVYVCVGHPHILSRLADRIAEDGLNWTRAWANLPELRADGTAVAVAVKQAWRDRDLDRDGAGDNNVIIAGRMAGFEDDDAEGN